MGCDGVVARGEAAATDVGASADLRWRLYNEKTYAYVTHIYLDVLRVLTCCPKHLDPGDHVFNLSNVLPSPILVSCYFITRVRPPSLPKSTTPRRIPQPAPNACKRFMNLVAPQTIPYQHHLVFLLINKRSAPFTTQPLPPAHLLRFKLPSTTLSTSRFFPLTFVFLFNISAEL